MKKTFSSRLRTLRGEASQAEFAAKIGTKQTTYSSWERGIKEPSLEVTAEISRLFGVSVDWLLGLTDDPTPRKSSGGVHINGVSHSVVNGHAVGSTISNGAGKDDSFVDRLKALEKAVEDLNVAVFRTEPAKRPVR